MQREIKKERKKERKKEGERRRERGIESDRKRTLLVSVYEKKVMLANCRDTRKESKESLLCHKRAHNKMHYLLQMN